MKKKRNWPPGLKGPFPMQELEQQAWEETEQQSSDPDMAYPHFLRKRWEAETKRRVALIAQFFDEPWPQSENDWLELIFIICTTFEAPGFQSGLPGASKKWHWQASEGLFADVMSVVVKHKRLSEYAAVKHIISNPSKFLNRYSKYKLKTLHRRFQRAKQQFEQNDRALRDEGLETMSRDEVIWHKIDLFSAEAHRNRTKRIAQKSAT
jgi:hypothetical protein